MRSKLRRILPLMWWFKQHNSPLTSMMQYHYIAHVKKTPKRVSVLTGSAWVHELLVGNDDRFEEVARMPKHVFKALVKELLEHGQLKPTHTVSANEQVAMYLYFAGHHASSANLQERFQHSGDTITRHLHRVQNAILQLAATYIQLPPDNAPLPRRVRDSRKFFPFFANCRMAVDGTHIPVSVPTKDVKAYQGRKGFTQNVLAACDFNMVFTYVLAGWEGSAGDGRIYADALEKGQKPRTKEELFNLRHAMLRNVVERIFGVLKKRFPVMSSPVEYSIGFQVDMVLSLCTVHNFIRLHGCTNDIYVQEATRELRARNNEPMQPNDQPQHHPDLETTEAKAWRDQLATDMWEQYQVHCNRRHARR
ncbi:hypothetical protein H257_16264 [Aphanomyces astaci]|uniref:DDE Tnp4 domain-containing protein n=1 Tax=Aphanomyces astaci TaxID=112090 RepID=W4FLG2_APHAT|nr:hypothetical protein H257_16264 [Aphanomyces astaci]ETV67533.1 hypothetical protein H257_16264 [Aphanomyces astaci]|eukprot:XP_009842937.1 hypothetical protein H257_16264 [Aphanomyces astaci]